LLTDLVGALRRRSWRGLGEHVALLALLAAQNGRSEAAARLLGHADRHPSPVGAHDVVSLYARTRALAAVEDSLEPAVFRRLHELGGRLAAEEVAGWAFGDDGRA
jgi:hypothetical protein